MDAVYSDERNSPSSLRAAWRLPDLKQRQCNSRGVVLVTVRPTNKASK
jgi:hypothetical protein